MHFPYQWTFLAFHPRRSTGRVHRPEDRQPERKLATAPDQLFALGPFDEVGWAIRRVSARLLQHVGRRNARGRARHGIRHSDRGFGGVSLAPLPATHRNSNSSAVRRPVTDDASHHRRRPPFRCDRRVLIRHGRACVPAPARPAMCRRCQTGRQSIQPARLQSREARCPNNSVQYYRFRRRSGGSNVR
jgi:hypothetical protein